MPLSCILSSLSPSASPPTPTGSNPSPSGSPEPTSDSRSLAWSKCQCDRSLEGTSRESRSPRGAHSPGVILELGTALQSIERGDLQHGPAEILRADPGAGMASISPTHVYPLPRMPRQVSAAEISHDVCGTWMGDSLPSLSSLWERVSNTFTGSHMAQRRIQRWK